MLDITPYSVFTTIIITRIFMILFLILLRRTYILCNINIKIVILIIILINIRLLVPIEFLFFSEAINSFEFMVELDKFIGNNIVLDKFTTFQYNFTIWNLLCLIWFIGFIISLYLYWRSYRLLHNRIKYIKPTNNENILKYIKEIKNNNKLKFNIHVISNKKIKFPAETGYFNKLILINENNYNNKDLYFILMHELSHFALKTNWIKLFMIFVNMIFWWNPIVRIFKNYVFYLLELYVDSYVIKNLNKNLKADYLSCILKVYKSADKYTCRFKNYINTFVYSSEERLLKKRFDFIKEQKKYNLLISALFLFILLSYIFVSFRFVIQPAYNPPAEEYDVPDFNTDNSYIIKEGNKYILYYNNQPYISSNNISTIPKIRNK